MGPYRNSRFNPITRGIIGKSLHLVLLAVFALGIGSAWAQQTGKILVGKTTNGNNAKTDFHIEIEADKDIEVLRNGLLPNGGGVSTQIVINMGQGIGPSLFVPKEGKGKKVTVEWNDLNIPANARVDYNVVSNQDKATKPTDKVRFTPANSPTDVPMLDWFLALSGDVSLLNGYLGEAIHFENLLFRIVDEQDMSLALLNAFIDTGSGGTTGFLVSGDVPGASTAGIPGELLVGNFVVGADDYLLARFDTRFVRAEFSPLIASVGLAENSAIINAVPEPSSLGLLCAGALGLFAAARARSALKWRTAQRSG